MTFGLDAPRRAEDFGVWPAAWLVQRRARDPARVDELPIRGSHNAANALAACALASRPRRAVAAAARRRCKQLQGPAAPPASASPTRRGVEWYDDSKGTNVGATVAALRGLGKQGGADPRRRRQGPGLLAARARRSREFAAHVLLIGRDAPLIAKALAGVPIEHCASLEEAVQRAASSRSRRSGAAVAGVRELRHVPRLQASRRGVRRGGEGGCAA